MKNNLKETVIENDYCIGCGACEFLHPTKYKVELSEHGMYKADVKDENLLTNINTEKVCPFSNASKNEDELSNNLFGENLNYDHRIGKYINCYAGHVNEGDFREKGSSGGFGKWLLNELLHLGYVNYVIQVEPGFKKDKLFTYSVFEKGDDILAGSTSAYYPVTMTEALNFIKNNSGKFAITALPCFSKAIRLLCLQDEVLNKRVKYILGIICGHLKSTGFAESLAWQIGVKPDNLKAIEFRNKIEGKKANEKGIYTIDKENNKSPVVSSRTLAGGNWGHGLFKYKACDYCDDIVGETADVSIGDAWLNEYVNDHRGTNILITRSREIDDIIKLGIKNKRLIIDEITKESVIKSQSGGIRHRREGLSYRLYLKEIENEWAPAKRVKPEKIESANRRRTYEIREKLSYLSHQYFLEAKRNNELDIYLEKINKIIDNYNLIDVPYKNNLLKLKLIFTFKIKEMYRKVRILFSNISNRF